MAWTYSDYPSQATDALRLARARLFKTEIINAITADVSADGKSRGNTPLNALLTAVNADIMEYERAVGRGSAGVLRADLRGGTG